MRVLINQIAILNSTNRNELNYDLTNDFNAIVDDPKDSISIMKDILIKWT